MEKELNEQALLRSNLPFNRVPGFAQKHNISLIFKYEKRKKSSAKERAVFTSFNMVRFVKKKKKI